MDEQNKLVVGIAGMPGAGKSVVLNVATGMGYDSVVMGDVVRQEAKRLGLEPTPENIGRTMLELRSREGGAVMAKRSILRIMEAKRNRVIVDGIRSLNEVEEFRRHFRKFCLMAICSSPQTRFQRLYRRGRSDDAEQWHVFHERDQRELSVGLGSAIAMADYTIVNEEGLASVKNSISRALKEAEDSWKR
jgi:dephospho-CoA kinase